MLGCDWLMLQHQPIKTKDSAKSFSLKAFTVSNAKSWLLRELSCQLQAPTFLKHKISVISELMCRYFDSNLTNSYLDLQTMCLKRWGKSLDILRIHGVRFWVNFVIYRSTIINQTSLLTILNKLCSNGTGGPTNLHEYNIGHGLSPSGLLQL